MVQPHYVLETKIVNKLAATPPRYIWTKHALEQMASRKISFSDIEHILMNGHVVLVEQKQDGLWRTRGRNIDGDDLEAVVAIDEDAITIKVVTAF
jgi:hypothetical protein